MLLMRACFGDKLLLGKEFKRARGPLLDVTIDDRGLIYLIDRQRGLDVIETSVW